MSDSYLWFDGLPAPLHLKDADELLPMISEILPRWPFERRDSADGVEPHFVITGLDAGRYETRVITPRPKCKKHDGVNALCEYVASTCWQILAAHPQYFCLHCAAVEVAGRLVLFPNSHRAGKSTLTAALAYRGARVFSDDYLPMEITADGRLVGIASGIQSRLRLPLPAEMDAGFRQWSEVNAGPSNAQYRYLDHGRLAPHGARAPLGAVVMLSREDDAPVELSSAPGRGAVEALLRQNFARSLHAGRVLAALDAIAAQVPLYALRYGDGATAAPVLLDTFATWSRPEPDLSAVARAFPRDADLAAREEKPAAYDEARAYRQAPGLWEVTRDGELFLTDASGLGVYRLNAGSQAIWRVLAEPMTTAEVSATLAEAFPTADPAQIAADCKRMIETLVDARLLVGS